MHFAPSQASAFCITDSANEFQMTDMPTRLRDARIAAGFDSASSAAQAMGVTVSTYVQHESGARGFPVSRAQRYAKFFRVKPEWLIFGNGEREAAVLPPTFTALPLLGRVQAGAWLAIDESSQEEPDMWPAALDRRYPHAPQWLREVQGDSMNARNIFPGDLVHLVDLTTAGISLNTGMIVEVIRSRDGGGLREITLKEVEVTPEGIVLWPRSLNAKWREPVRMGDGSEQDIEVQITGLLLAKITRF
jgi:SOS-response transcriptional repressor LexA